MKDKFNYKPDPIKEKEHKNNGAKFYFNFKAEGMALFYIPLTDGGMDDLKKEMTELKNKSFLTIVTCYGEMYSISTEKVLNGIVNVELIDL